MQEWEMIINVNGRRKNISISGNTLKSAVKLWGKKQKEGTEISCGQLIRIKEDRVYKYWSGEEFMRCLD